MDRIKYLFTLFLFAGCTLLFAQRGKNGSLTVSAGNTIVNEFTSLSADAFTGTLSIQVISNNLNTNNRFSAALAAGDLIFIYQTKGVTIKGSFIGTVGDPRDSTMGEITNYGNTGNFEFAEVKGVPDATTIELSCPLKNNYTSGLGRTQVIRVPRYSTLTVNNAGVLTTQTWDGSIGGVLAVEVTGNTLINAGGSINTTGLGFRGGSYSNNSAAWTLGSIEGSADSREGADKGEGVAGYQSEYDLISGRYGRGAMANGGGGGCTNNAGGGGGANAGNIAGWNGHGIPDVSLPSYIAAWNLEYSWKSATKSSGGGKGGYCFANSNNDPTLVGPANTLWGAGKRNNMGGYGGRPLDYSTGKIFLGGGGGAGQGNDGYPGPGGNGGGLIYLMCYNSISGAGQIISNGANGSDAQGIPAITKYTGIDGAGGAGAGGTIILNITSGTASGFSALANGGSGGNQVLVKGALSGGPVEAEGPGGGGSGGYIGLTAGVIAQQVNAGNNGTTNSPLMNVAGKLFQPNGATKGDSGISRQTIITFNIAARDTIICNSRSVTLSALLSGTVPSGIQLTWYDAAIGGNVVGSGNSYTTPVLTTTTTYYVGSCPGFYRVPVKVTVGGPFTSTLTATNATCTSGGSISVTLSGGIAVFTYSWSNAATGATLNNLAAGSYTVTVTDAGGCTTTSSATITGASTINVSANTATNLSCFGQSNGSVAMNPSGGQTPYTYLWNNSATSQTISALAAGSYTVTVTDASGCTAISTVSITQPVVINAPTFNITNASCGANTGSAVATTSGGTGTLTYTWNNNISGQTISAVVAGSYTVTITDANSCTRIGVTVIGSTGGATVTAYKQSDVSCKGGNNGSASVTAAGGTPNYTYSWSNGTSGVTGITGVTAGTYIVSVTDAAGCTAVSSVIITEPSSGINSPTFTIVNAGCIASNGSITASTSGGTGALTYTWSNSVSGQTNSGLAAGPYTVTVTDANGCTTSSTATVGSTSGGTTTTSVQTNVKCNGGNTGIATVTAAGGTPNYTYSWSNAAGGQTASGLIARLYTVTVTDASGCSATSTVNITEPGVIVTPTFTTNNASCGVSNGSATTTSSGGTGTLTYTWSNAVSGQTNSGLAAVSYTVTVTDANACTKSAVAVVGNTGGGTATTSVQSNVSCKGGSNGSTSVVAAGGTPNYTYSWSNGMSGVTGITGLTAGTYVVSVTDASGCTAVSSVTITEPATSVRFSMIGTVDAGCGANSGWANAVATDGTSTYTYTWSNGVSGQTNSGIAGGNYIVTVTDANGCTASSTVTVGSTGGGTATTSIQSNVLCKGGSDGSVTATASGGTPAYTYSWSNGISGSTGISGLAAGTYSVSVTDASGCTAVSSVSITEPPTSISNPTFTTTSAACGANNGSAVVTVSGGTGTLMYSWSAPGGTGQTMNALTAGSYTITVTDANACTKTGVAIVGSAGGATANAKVQSNVSCKNGNNGSALLTASGGTPNYTYSWSNGISGATAITGLTAGTYVVSVTDASGCTSISSVNITEPSAINAPTFTKTNANCGASNGTATAATSGGSGSLTYSWSNNVVGQTNNGLSAGSYSLTITDANACTVSAALIINSTGGGTASATVQSNVSCNGGNNGTAIVNITGGTPNYTYSWSNGAAGKTATGLASVTYTVTITDASGCIATSTVNITQPSVLSISISSSVVCGTNNGTATAIASGGMPTYSFNWSPMGGNNSIASGLSSGTYTCIVTDANGCTKSTSINVIAKPAPSINAGADTSIFSGDSFTLDPAGSSSLIYQWSPSEGLSCTNCRNPVANPATKTTYCVLVSDTNGCSNSSCVTVDVRCGEIFTPSAFSPDRNSQNDVYYVRGGCIKTLYFAIFNRWGEKVFETTYQSSGWDGTYKGQACSSDVYTYFLNATLFDGSAVSRKGNITLVK